MNWFSSITSTLRLFAFSSFDPAFFPAISRSVFLLMLEDVFPPFSFMAFWICVRVNFSRVPVTTIVLPVRILLFLAEGEVGFRPAVSICSITVRLSLLRKYSRMLVAMIGPIWSIASRVSASAWSSFSRVPNSSASISAEWPPTFLMPRAAMNRQRFWVLLFSMLSRTFAADLSAILSSWETWSKRRLYRSAKLVTSLWSTSCSMRAGPMFSMSIWPLPTKYWSFCLNFSVQSGFVQRMYTPFSSFVTFCPQPGHWVGISKGLVNIGLLSWRTFTTWGMISPAFSIITVSSARTSRRFSSSKLWRLARFTVVPARRTGLRLATGVSVPVLPSWTSIDSTVVCACSAGNLYEMHHLGARPVVPSISCWSKRFTFMTMPSIW